jgi:hypothetical protein
MKSLKSKRMKTKILLLAMTSGLAAASCSKTYTCTDKQTGIVTCEVGAHSQAEADKLCNQDGMNPSTATKK